jgi:hypothetical protein
MGGDLMGFHEDLEKAIECLTEFTGLNIESMIEDGIMTKSDVIDSYKNALSRGWVSEKNKIKRLKL